MAELLDLEPLFPLPNVVLFPKGILPLYVFEPRYRSMMADAPHGGQTIDRTRHMAPGDRRRN
jgi:Lon protease-like protein